MPSLTTLITECAAALHDLEGSYTVASATGTTVVISALVNTVSNASALRYDGRWIYYLSGTAVGTVSPLKSGTYAPSTGTLTTALTAWVTTPATNDTAIITGLYPAISSGGRGVSYRSLINMALTLIDIPRRIAPTVTTTGEYALSTWVGWISEDRIRKVARRLPDGRVIQSLDVREPAPTSGFPHQLLAAREWEYISDEDTPKLRSSSLFANTSGTPTLEVMADAPAWSWVESSGTWGEGGGLVNPSDRVLPQATDIVDVFTALAYRSAMNAQPGVPSDPQALKKFTDALDRARSVPGYNRNAERRLMPEVAQLEAAA